MPSPSREIRELYFTLSLSSSASTRLFTLFAGQRDEQICGFLQHAKLKDIPEYEALSYEWGPANFEKKVILLNGDEFEIGFNLFSALLEMRSPDYDRLMWIDAICINQHDVTERNHQVGIMRSIYSQASRVLMWLGPRSKNSDIAMAMIRRYGTTSFKLSVWKPTNESISLEEKRVGQREQAQAMVDLLVNRTYWNRVWIVQEIILGKSIQIYCGSEVAPWNAIHCFINPRLDLIPQDFLEPLSTSRTAYLYRNRFASMGRGKTGGLTVARWLTILQGSTCSVPRDVVYGVLAIASDGFKITVDYEKSDWEVYLDIMKLYKHEENPLSLMSLLQRLFPLHPLTASKPLPRNDKECTSITGTMLRPDLYTENCHRIPIQEEAWQHHNATSKQLFDTNFDIKAAKDRLEVGADVLKSFDRNKYSMERYFQQEENVSFLTGSGMPVFGIVPGLNGLFSLPGNTKLGDYICMFDNCDGVLALRRKPTYIPGLHGLGPGRWKSEWELIGMGILHQSLSYLNLYGLDIYPREHLCELKVEVSLGYPLLQKLTAPV